MNTKKRIRMASPLFAIAAATVIVATAVESAIGESTKPWENLNNRSIYWEYSFNSATPLVADSSYNEFLTATAPMFSSVSAIETTSGQLSLTDGGELRIDVPNGRDLNNIKHFWFSFDISGNVTVIDAGSLDVPMYSMSPIMLTENTATHVEGYVDFVPQPASEWVTLGLGQGASIDNLKIGSYCEVIPEPASAALLLLFFPLMLIRRNFFSGSKQGSGKLYMRMAGCKSKCPTFNDDGHYEPPTSERTALLQF